MSETERLTVGALVSVLALVVPGFVLHEAPRFPGSLVGSLLGIAGATLFMLLLVYSLVKRSSWLRSRTTGYVSMRGVLSFHVYAGVLGALLGILHSGHKYQSALGIALVSAMLVIVLSGFVGRYYLTQLGTDLREQQVSLGLLRARYDLLAAGAALPGLQPSGAAAGASRRDVRRLVGAIAELEYAITRREIIKRALSRWTMLHVAAALVLYPLLALHIWNGVYFGLRWLP